MKNPLSKILSLFIALLLVFGQPVGALALPAGEALVGGSATFDRPPDGVTFNVNQLSDKAIINYNDFSIAGGETVNFFQPSTSSIALNRVIGVNPSSILGALNANGQVFLINPNGILFGSGASINVHGLMASTLNISNADFMAGNYSFLQDPAKALSSVTNLGVLTAKDTGYIVLAAPTVENMGVIQANLGTIALGSGEGVTLSLGGDKLISFAVDEEVSGALATYLHNAGTLQADSGTILLEAKTAAGIIGSVVNNEGIIQANTIVPGEDGTVRLVSDKDLTHTGTINAGGDIEIRADGGIYTSGALTSAAGNIIFAPNYASAGYTVDGDGNLVTPTGDLIIDGGSITISGGAGSIFFGYVEGGDPFSIEPGDPLYFARTLDISGASITNNGTGNIAGISYGDTYIDTSTITAVGGGVGFVANPTPFFPDFDRILGGNLIVANSDINAETGLVLATGSNLSISDSNIQNTADIFLASLYDTELIGTDVTSTSGDITFAPSVGLERGDLVLNNSSLTVLDDTKAINLGWYLNFFGLFEIVAFPSLLQFGGLVELNGDYTASADSVIHQTGSTVLASTGNFILGATGEASPGTWEDPDNPGTYYNWGDYVINPGAVITADNDIKIMANGSIYTAGDLTSVNGNIIFAPDYDSTNPATNDNLTMTGGTIQITDPDASGSIFFGWASGNPLSLELLPPLYLAKTLTLSGGEVHNYGSGAIAGFAYDDVNLSGINITAEKGSIAFVADAPTLLEGLDNSLFANDGYIGDLNMTGGSILAKGDSSTILLGSGGQNVKLLGGTVENSGNVDGEAITIGGRGNVIISGTDVTSQYGRIRIYANLLPVLNAPNASPSDPWYSEGNFEMTGGSLTVVDPTSPYGVEVGWFIKYFIFPLPFAEVNWRIGYPTGIAIKGGSITTNNPEAGGLYLRALDSILYNEAVFNLAGDRFFYEIVAPGVEPATYYSLDFLEDEDLKKAKQSGSKSSQFKCVTIRVK